MEASGVVDLLEWDNTCVARGHQKNLCGYRGRPRPRHSAVGRCPARPGAQYDYSGSRAFAGIHIAGVPKKRRPAHRKRRTPGLQGSFNAKQGITRYSRAQHSLADLPEPQSQGAQHSAAFLPEPQSQVSSGMICLLSQSYFVDNMPVSDSSKTRNGLPASLIRRRSPLHRQLEGLEELGIVVGRSADRQLERALLVRGWRESEDARGAPSCRQVRR